MSLRLKMQKYESRKLSILANYIESLKITYSDINQNPVMNLKSPLDLMIREINENDFRGLSELYTHLHNNKLIENNTENMELFRTILQDENHHIIVAEESGKIVSSCVCVIVPNLTHNQQPYALIENVVTDKAYRKLGLATACLSYAKQIAVDNHCYKIMLLTGSKKRSVHKFYQKNGYNRFEKTGYIQRLK